LVYSLLLLYLIFLRNAIYSFPPFGPPEHHRFRSDADERREEKVVDVDYALLDLWQLQQNNLKVPVDRGRVRGGVRFTDEALRRGLYGIAEVLDGVV
jgi:hypothetical protein